MTAFRLAFLNLSRRKIPTMIVFISISISVSCGGILYRSFILGQSRFSLIDHRGDAIVGAKSGGIDILLNCMNLEGPFPDFIPFKLYQSLKNQENIKFEDQSVSNPKFLRSIIPILYFANYKNYRVLGTDE